MRLLKLDKDWKLRSEPLFCDKDHYADAVEKQDGWLPVGSLPCDVHVPLIDAGIIREPLVADNCLRCEWIEDRSWWFAKTFDADEALLRSDICELVIEGLDVKADLFLNGSHIGHHDSSFYPFRADVRDHLRTGANLLVVRVTSGLEYFSDFDLSKIKDFISCEYKGGRGTRGDNRRAMVRKPQYVYGWDWSPRLATCGIMGSAWIEARTEIAVRQVRFVTNRLSGNSADITVEVEIENLHPISTMDADVRLDILFGETSAHVVEKEVFLSSGLNFVRFDLLLDDPKLWWPNGMGAQNLYKVRVSATTQSGHSDCREISTGIRTIRLNMDKITERSRMFAFEINGVRTFCKGGNWETPDAVYGRIADAKYKTLVREAAEANFNMLRFNGVNAYERDFFYDCCDRYGIMIWQDFAGFSCAAYPDELDWFRAAAEHEADYQTKRLRSHPCIVLWCGNNECLAHLAVYRKGGYWAGDRKPASSGGMVIYNEVMPRVIRTNCPEIPYWNSSPYGGAADLESNDYGDRHEWVFMSRDMGERITPEEYDKVASKFISEFGCIGPTKKSSLVKYYGSENIDTDSDIWKMHTNTFEKNTVRAAIVRHYTGERDLSLDDYLLYAGMFQGFMLGYAMESMRNAENNHGALLWSYNDAWGEIGWSIIDHYTTRKIAFYFVKRALAHRKLILRKTGGLIDVICMNDTAVTMELDLEYGYVSFDGEKTDTAVRRVTVPPFTKAAAVAVFEMGQHNARTGLFYAKVLDPDSGIAPAILRTGDQKDLAVPVPDVRITGAEKRDDRITFTVTSGRYAHGVHFGLGDGALPSDEYFDLLPGESREIAITGDIADLRVSDLAAACVIAMKTEG